MNGYDPEYVALRDEIVAALDLNTLTAHFQDLDPDQYAGVRYNPYLCPLAHYLGKLGYAGPYVGSSLITVNDTTLIVTPLVSHLTKAIDRTPTKNDKVTAHQVLRAIEVAAQQVKDCALCQDWLSNEAYRSETHGPHGQG